jgi:ribonuclease-3
MAVRHPLRAPVHGGQVIEPPTASLQQALGHDFTRGELLREALTHRSLAQHRPRRRRSDPPSTHGDFDFGYERLEFLGDRVLGLIVAEMLFEAFPTESEGDLARRHAQLVRKESLAAVAADIGIAQHIRLPGAEESTRQNANLLADVCEALIAALYLDGGHAAARRFVERHWQGQMIATFAPPKDAKTGLQEWAQGQGLALPSYTLVATDGPPHQPVFTVKVAVADLGAAVASGASKRLAESTAAADLLARLKELRR